MEKKSIDGFKPIIKMLTFQFCLGSISNGLDVVDSKDISLK